MVSSPRQFSLLVKPASADCNLRCEYCFYLSKSRLYPETPKHRMSDAVLERMISSFLAMDLPSHSFGWQGGEPTLMGLDFFKKVTEYQIKHGSGVSVSNGLQTNTTLLDDEFAKHLAEYHFLVGVSVDGPAEVHDHYRKRGDGQGTHAAVMAGLESLKKHKVDYNILTLVNHNNVGMPGEIYRYLCEMGVNFHQYIECVEFDERGDLMPFAITGEQWGDFLCGIYDEWQKGDTRTISVRLFDTIVSMMVDGIANTCVATKDCRSYLVVEWNGDVYPCDFFVTPELKLGNVMENSWEEMLTSELYETFGARKARWNDECEACQYLSYCAGCCPKNRPSRGVDPTQLSALCSGWKKFYHHSLKGFRELANEIVAERAQQGGQQQASDVPTGRNDPCPCGSGKKFKKCCGS